VCGKKGISVKRHQIVSHEGDFDEERVEARQVLENKAEPSRKTPLRNSRI
jgi:hypothetical protein